MGHVYEFGDLTFEFEGRDALSYHRTLQDTIDALTTVNNNLNSDIDRQQLIEELQNIHQGFGSYLRFLLPPKLYNEHRAETSTTAQEVFDIPELLELILLQADLVDIISMCQVSRKIKTTVEASPSLQVKLCLKAAAASAERTTPFRQSFPSLRVALKDDDDWGWGNAAEVSADFYLSTLTRKLPFIGVMMKRLLICQPPVKEMSVKLSCFPHGTVGDLNGVRITSSTGLTIGDLYDKAVSMLPDDTSRCSCQVVSGWSGTWDDRTGISGVHFETVDDLS